jgi:hypothetical protein
VVTVDAMGCQKGTVRHITEQKGYYLLAVKENHKNLFMEVWCVFKASRPIAVSEEWEYDHGRFEIRRCSILLAASAMDEQVAARWAGLQTLVRLESTRIVGDKQTTEAR